MKLLKLRNNSEDTVLHLAADANCIDVVKFLLESGCDVNETRAMRNTALHSAASKGYRELVEALLEVYVFFFSSVKLLLMFALFLIA